MPIYLPCLLHDSFVHFHNTLSNLLIYSISADNRKVYLVNGLFSSWEEMLQHRKPPILLTATLLPWKNVIISDGLVSITNINFGKTYSSDFKEIYLNAKRNGNIIKSL